MNNEELERITMSLGTSKAMNTVADDPNMLSGALQHAMLAMIVLIVNDPGLGVDREPETEIEHVLIMAISALWETLRLLGLTPGLAPAMLAVLVARILNDAGGEKAVFLTKDAKALARTFRDQPAEGDNPFADFIDGLKFD